MDIFLHDASDPFTLGGKLMRLGELRRGWMTVSSDSPLRRRNYSVVIQINRWTSHSYLGLAEERVEFILFRVYFLITCISLAQD